jgi:hypothetical protein
VDDRVDPNDPVVRRKNIRLAFILLLVIVGVTAVPVFYRRAQAPADHFPTYADAREANAAARGLVPAFLPEGAEDIHTRTHRNAGWRIVRFAYPAGAEEQLAAGMRRVEPHELERIPVPTTGWDRWWPISSRTFQGRQGEFLDLYQVPDDRGGGFLALDPRTRLAYYWREERS